MEVIAIVQVITYYESCIPLHKLFVLFHYQLSLIYLNLIPKQQTLSTNSIPTSVKDILYYIRIYVPRETMTRQQVH